MRIFLPMLLVIAPIGELMMIPLLGWTFVNLRRGRKAMLIAPEGLTVGFGYQVPIQFSWRQISSIYRKEGPRPESAVLCIGIVDEPAFFRSVGTLQRMMSKFPGAQATLSVGLSTLDTSWTELSEQLRAYAKVRGTEPTPDELRQDAAEQVMIEDIQRNIHDAVTLSGTLSTREDYLQQFRKNLVGCWISADWTFTQSPVDQSAVFLADGTGEFTAGPLHHPIEFFWRESGDYRIEVRLSEADKEGNWIPLSYGFTDDSTPVLWFELAEELEDDWSDLVFDRFTFTGLPRK